VLRYSISTAGRGVTAGPGLRGLNAMTARVVSVHPKAAYVRTAAGDLFALTTPAVPAGPIHAATAGDLGHLRLGDHVTVDLSDAARWEGALPSRLDTDLLLDVLATGPRSSLEPLPAGDLVAYLGGRGPGLTPAGDDVLAGMFLIAYVCGDDVTEQAAAVPTNDIARAFLHWAARGQSIEPVHRLLTATGEREAHQALADLLRFGHSSGADLALGLRTAVERTRRNVAVQRLCNGVRNP